MTNGNYSSSFDLTTPPRAPQRKRTASPISVSSPLQTPTPASRCLRRRAIALAATPRMSPSPSLLRTPSKRGLTSSLFSADRFIPSRRRMNVELCRRALLAEDQVDNGTDDSCVDKPNTATKPTQNPLQNEYKRRMLSSLCNVPLESLDENGKPKSLFAFGTVEESGSSRLEDPYSHDILRVLQQFETPDDLNDVYHEEVSDRVIPNKPKHIVACTGLVDDFYRNIISWSQNNVLAIALGRSVCLWNATTQQVEVLMTAHGEFNYVTSVAWCTNPGQSKYLAIGTNSKTVQLWDTQTLRQVRTLQGHHGRVGALAWNRQWLTSGGQDSFILQHDLRSSAHVVATYEAHEEEVCGLKWNEDGTNLASGGNENYLCIWDAAMSSSSAHRHRNNNPNEKVAPRLLLRGHKAAVKALDWCPFQRGVLASGGGSADKTIKMWDANDGTLLNSINTGSQVCSLLWSPQRRELCSAHGFSDNQLTLWKYGKGSNLTKMKDLTGHTQRVLGMACSPDHNTVASVGGNSLRFWNIFGNPPKRRSSSVLSIGEVSFGTPIR